MSKTFQFGNGEWAVGKETVLAYNDENNNFKPLPFTFDRASTATVVNKDGLIETVGVDEPRIDFKDNSKGALLLEPSRTNIFLYGLNMQNWQGLSGASFQLNNDISPDGSQNATKITYNGTDNGRLEKQVSTSSGTVYTFSVWLKNIDISDPTQIYLGFSQTSQGEHITITNEWKRYSVTITADASNEYPRINSDLAGSLLAYGAQFEASNYMTSLIPTQGSAVTRSADSCSQTVPDGVIGQTEGTLLVDFNFNGDISGNRSVAILSSGGSADFIASFIFNNLFYARIRANNGSVIDVTKSNLTSGNHKIAIAYASNDLTFYLDGNIVGQNTSASVSFGSELSTIKIGESTSGTAELGGLVSKTSLYNTRLSNTELQALTT